MKKVHRGAKSALAIVCAAAIGALAMPAAHAATYGGSTLTATPSTVTVGESIDLAFHMAIDPVTSDDLTVLFEDAQGNDLATEPLVENSAVLDYAAQAVGTTTFTATLMDNNERTDSVATASVNIVEATPGEILMDLAVTPEQAFVGSDFRATATFNITPPNGSQVEFSANNKVIDTVTIPNGKSTVSLTQTAAKTGIYTIVARLLDANGARTVTDAATSVIVAGVTTSTILTATGEVKPSTKTTLKAQVASVGSTYASGKVEFWGTYTPAGGSAAPAALLATGTLDATAKTSVDWTTPANAGSMAVIAKYLGDAQHAESTSVKDTINITTGNTTVTLTAPASAYVGTSTNLTAAVTPRTATGKVTFFADGTALGSPVTITSGIAQYAWKPTAIGSVTLSVKYYDENGTLVDTGKDVVTKVSAGTTVDTITIKTATGSTLSTSTALSMTKGQSVDLTATAKSGATVTLTATGECTLSGGETLTANAIGSCSIKAVTAGKDAYAATTGTYPVTVKSTTPAPTPTPTPSNNTNVDPTPGAPGKASTAKLTAPSTAKAIKAKKSIVLSAKPVKASSGKTVTWTTSTPKVCKVSVDKKGKVTLTALTAGSCTVTAKAAGVTGVWHPYAKTMTYKVVK